MRLGAVLAALAALAALATASAEAQQLDFKRVSRSGDELLSYRWRDQARHERSVAFTLTRQAIREAEASFAEFSLDALWKVVERDLHDEVEQFGNGAHIELTRTADGLRWSLRARDPKSVELLTRKVEDRLAKSRQAYLARHLRRMAGDRRIVVDFAGATTALAGPLRAVARALGDVPDVADNERGRIALALGFFQEIPYALLEDKQRQGGDFLPAPALLAQNRGDCDSKAVALAAVLRTLMRWRKLAVVTMPGHAILAVDLPAQSGDATIRSGGRLWVALEPAGPAMAAVGQVSSLTAKYIERAREIEIWPLD